MAYSDAFNILSKGDRLVVLDYPSTELTDDTIEEIVNEVRDALEGMRSAGGTHVCGIVCIPDDPGAQAGMSFVLGDVLLKALSFAPDVEAPEAPEIPDHADA